MATNVVGDPFAGEAQWVIEVAKRRLPSSLDVLTWNEKHPIPTLQDRTAADLVRDGNALAVVAFLDSLEDNHAGDDVADD